MQSMKVLQFDPSEVEVRRLYHKQAASRYELTGSLSERPTSTRSDSGAEKNKK